MIQKNRIMTKKGIIIFDRNIDVEKTQENVVLRQEKGLIK